MWSCAKTESKDKCVFVMVQMFNKQPNQLTWLLVLVRFTTVGVGLSPSRNLRGFMLLFVGVVLFAMSDNGRL